MKILCKKYSILLLLVMNLALSPTLYAEGAIIGHTELQIESLSQTDVRRIFLGKTTAWDDGSAVRPCYLTDETIAGSFYETLKRKPEQFDAYWNKKIFSGEGVKPAAFDSTAAINDFIKNNKGAICFTDMSAIGESKVIAIQ